MNVLQAVFKLKSYLPKSYLNQIAKFPVIIVLYRCFPFVCFGKTKGHLYLKNVMFNRKADYISEISSKNLLKNVYLDL